MSSTDTQSSADITRPLPEDGDAPARTAPLARRLGGRYVLLQRLGSGGSGEVFSAFDPVLDRRVAVKLLLTQGDSSSTLVREGRLLAKLEHPCVVTVHDLGVDGEQAFMAMELLEGEDILSFAAAARQRDDLRSILELLTTVGKGLAAAHRAGIVHGDIKPSNVLRSKQGRTKLSDFGIARLLEHHANAAGHGIAGTPAYLAPEQHAGEPATELADQYAFCLTAWILFHGDHPFADGSSSRGLTHSQEIEDTDRSPGPKTERPEPMLALGRAQQRWSPQFTAAAPHARAAQAIERGLRLDPAERWPTMEALLAQLAPPRRTGLRRGVAVAAAVGTGLGAWALWQPDSDLCRHSGTAIEQTWGDAQRQEMASQWSDAGESFGPTLSALTDRLDHYAERWSERSRDNCRATHVQHSQSDAMLDLRTQCLRAAQASLEEAVAVLTTDDRNVWLNALQVVGELPQLDRCSDLEALARREPLPADADVATRVEAAQRRLERGKFEMLSGALDDAEASVQVVAAELEELSFGPLTSQYWVLRANIGVWTAKGEAAVEDAKAALHHALRFSRPRDMLDAAALTAMALEDAGRHDEARHYVDLALAMAHRDDVTDDGRSMAHSAAAHLFTATSELARAEEHARASIRDYIAANGPDEPGLGAPYSELGLVLHQQGKLREAQEYYALSLEVRQKSLGQWHQQIAQSHHNLSLIYGDSSDTKRAEEHSRKALEIATRIFGDKDPRVGQIHNSLAGLLHNQGRTEEASEHFEASLAAFPDPSSVSAAHARVSYAQLLDSLGRSDEARTLLQRALADQRALVGDEHPEIARTRVAMATMYKQQGLYDEARAQYEAAEVVFLARGDESHPNRLSALVGRALVERDAGHPTRARALLQETAALIEASGQPSPYLSRTIEDYLGKLDHDQGDHERATEHWTRAYEIELESDRNPARLTRLALDLADALWEQGDTEAGRSWADKATGHASEVAGERAEQWKQRAEKWHAAHPRGGA